MMFESEVASWSWVYKWQSGTDATWNRLRIVDQEAVGPTAQRGVQTR